MIVVNHVFIIVVVRGKILDVQFIIFPLHQQPGAKLLRIDMQDLIEKLKAAGGSDWDVAGLRAVYRKWGRKCAKKFVKRFVGVRQIELPVQEKHLNFPG